MQDLISQVEDLAGIEIDHTTSVVMIFGIIFLYYIFSSVYVEWDHFFRMKKFTTCFGTLFALRFA